VGEEAGLRIGPVPWEKTCRRGQDVTPDSKGALQEPMPTVLAGDPSKNKFVTSRLLPWLREQTGAWPGAAWGPDGGHAHWGWVWCRKFASRRHVEACPS